MARLSSAIKGLLAAAVVAGMLLVPATPAFASSPTFTIDATPSWYSADFSQSVDVVMRAGSDNEGPYDYELTWTDGSFSASADERLLVRTTVTTECDGLPLTLDYTFSPTVGTSASGSIELPPCYRLPLSASISGNTLTAQITSDGAPLEDGAMCHYSMFFGSGITTDGYGVNPVMDGSFGQIEAIGRSADGACPVWNVSLPKTKGTTFIVFGSVESIGDRGFLMDTNPAVLSAPATATQPNVSPDITSASLPTLWVSDDAVSGVFPTTYVAHITGGSLPGGLTYNWSAIDYSDPTTPVCDAPTGPACVQKFESGSSDTFTYNTTHSGGIAAVFVTVFSDSDGLAYLNAGIDPIITGTGGPAYMIVMVDESGSMRSKLAETKADYRAARRSAAAGLRGDLVFFSRCGMNTVATNKLVRRLPSLATAGYQPRRHCLSPIYDRIAAEIQAAAKAHPGQALAFVIVTDARDNASTSYSKRKLDALIARKVAAGWTFSFPMAQV